jgi:hypothetical protein
MYAGQLSSPFMVKSLPAGAADRLFLRHNQAALRCA